MIIITDPDEAQQLKEAGEELVPFIAEDEDGMPELRWRTWTRREKDYDRKTLTKKNRRGRGPVTFGQPIYAQKRQLQRGKTMQFAAFVRLRRKELGLTQEELSTMAGMSRVGLAYIEGGQRKAKPRTQRKIREALQIAQVGRVRRFVHALNAADKAAA